MQIQNRVVQTLLKGRWLFVLMIVFLAFSVWLEKQSGSRFFGKQDTAKFQEVLDSKEKETSALMDDVLASAVNMTSNELIGHYAGDLADLSDRGIAVVVYWNDSLIFWSDNTIPVPSLRNEFPDGNLVGIANSFFVRSAKKDGKAEVIGLILIKTEYPYENRFLRNGFQDDFGLSPEIGILPGKENKPGNEVFNESGSYLFGLDYRTARKLYPIEKQISVLMYLFVFMLFLFFLRRFVHNADPGLKKPLFLLTLPVLAAVYFFLHYYRLPEVVFDLELFSPARYAHSTIFPSLGDLFLLSLMCFYAAYNFYKEFIFDLSVLKKHPSLIWLLTGVFAVLILLWFFLTVFLFKSLILDSTISFETYKVLNLTIYTFIGFLVIILLFTTLSLLTDKVLGILKNSGNKSWGLYLVITINLFLFICLLSGKTNIDVSSFIFFFLLSLLIWFMRIRRVGNYSFSSFVGFVLLFSVYTVAQVFIFTGEKSRADMKIKAVNLSAEHDPVAELLFVDIDARLRKDRELQDLVLSPRLDFDRIYASLQRRYFSGFWDKYELQVTLCKPADSLYVAPPDNSWYPCYNFFENIITQEGIQVPNTGFYFLDYLNGRISYFAAIPYKEGKIERSLFIELNSRLIAEGLGYPELLLDDKFNPPPSAGDYSYAKYNKGRLITFSGSFAYYTSSSIYTDGKEGWSYIKKDKYDHLIYNIDGVNTIIVSKASILWVDYIISFSYIFIFYFILNVMFLLITNISPVSTRMQWNFKNRIQFAITGLLLFSLSCIGAGIVYFSIKQYENKHIEILQEKIQSVYVELIHKLEFEKDLHNWSAPDYYNLDDLLEKSSNVFYTDINMYDGKGELLATSRPEIIENNLISDRMNSESYLEMVIHRRSEYIHSENIGGLEYLSAYVPFVNSENKVLAYLNLPYFTRQNELTSEIANLVIAIVNILVILSLLSFTIALFLSNQLTQPLRLLQESFARVSLKSVNESISYSGRDEIGSLVKEYNKMVEQLKTSAELLARSERELAWREMAKQIAHEIKNPLTPMRLSIQHLQRSAKDRKENWDEQFERTSRMLIEQIDNLSAIATEFSNFAKMPAARNENLELVRVLTDTCGLFENTENLSFSIAVSGIKELYVYADREQISRVFINLIKNAIQAIPESRECRLEVKIEKKDDKALVSFRDNGRGIPEDIRDKLFQPNFTTKSGGMGMGLAIAESILKNAGGRIFYETELKKGSVFIVELPLLINNI